MPNLDVVLKSGDITLQTKIVIVKSMVFPEVMYECESCTIKKGDCWRIDAFKFWCWRSTLESSLDSKDSKPINPKGNHLWIFIGETDAEAEAPILWPPDAKSRLIEKDWCWERLRISYLDKIFGWHHQLSWHEFEETPGDGEGQGSLACCSLWGPKELDTTERQNSNKSKHFRDWREYLR